MTNQKTGLEIDFDRLEKQSEKMEHSKNKY